MENEDNKLIEFRKTLKLIKSNVLKNHTYNSQNTNSLNTVIKRLIQFYYLLEPVIFQRKPIETIKIKELQELFYNTLKDGDKRSSNYQNKLEYYIKRDFIDFPFVIDETNIDTYNSSEHYENPLIVDNNKSLTE